MKQEAKETADVMLGLDPSTRYISFPIVYWYGKSCLLSVRRFSLLLEKVYPGASGVLVDLMLSISRDISMFSTKACYHRYSAYVSLLCEMVKCKNNSTSPRYDISYSVSNPY